MAIKKNDKSYQLSREGKVIIFQFHIGHNKSSYLFNRLKIGPNNKCTCGTIKMTEEQVLQECPMY